MVGSSCPAGAGAPYVGREYHRGQKEKRSRDLQPQDSAHPPEGPQKSAKPLCHSAAGLSRDSAGLHSGLRCSVSRGPNLGVRLDFRPARRRSGCAYALASHAARHPHPDPQHPPDVFRLHSVYDGSSDPVYAASNARACHSRLPASRIGSKVKEIVRCIPRDLPRRPPPLEVPVTSRLRELIQQLGEAIHESVIESEQIAGVVQDIRRHGFDVLLMLEATIGLNEVTQSPKGAEVTVGEADGDAMSFTPNDLSFLRSLRISVEGDDDPAKDS